MIVRLVLAMATIAILTGKPAAAADGEVLISQASVIAGGVTSGDGPGFPLTISEPGRYRLTGNLSPGAGADGIVIKADNVTLDLDGFALQAALTAALASPPTTTRLK